MSTLVLGASLNPSRYSNLVVKRLIDYPEKVFLVGRSDGAVEGIPIYQDVAMITAPIDTITVYLNPQNLVPYKNYILKEKPRRVIFNPGTEDYEFMKVLKEEGIEPLEACTLVMLSNHSF